MKRLPVGIQSIREILNERYVYVDKTEYVYTLMNDAKHYFLSRPRRFGKSLLLDTISSVFSGDKELFKGLWIYDSDCEFIKHPVIRLDMSGISNGSPDILEKSLFLELKKRIGADGLDIPDAYPADMLKFLIEGLYEKYGQKVVVLIDEYDKPMLDHLTNLQTAEANRDILRGFYGILKSMDKYLRFTFITGVTKFAKTSIFSGLNYLYDISLSMKYANICGITNANLNEYFDEHISKLTSLSDFNHIANLHDEILKWYDGYSWDGKTRVLNPFSLLCFFAHKKFFGFWFESGSPKFLIDLIKKNPETYIKINKSKISEFMLDAADFYRLAPESLMFQSGYLTISKIDITRGAPVYHLIMPNHEVRETLNLHIIAGFADCGGDGAQMAKYEMEDALQAGDLAEIRAILKRLFASIPYNLHVDVEAYYHSIFYAVMTVLGFNIDAEVAVSKGRIDAVLELSDKIYVMEFKYENCAPDADAKEKHALFDKALENGMNQIKNRGYQNKYAGGGKVVYLAAFAFLGRDDIEMEVEII